MTSNLPSVGKAMATLDALQDSVEQLPRSTDPDSIRQVVTETEQALDALKLHHAAPHVRKAKEAVGSNGTRRKR